MNFLEPCDKCEHAFADHTVNPTTKRRECDKCNCHGFMWEPENHIIPKFTVELLQGTDRFLANDKDMLPCWGIFFSSNSSDRKAIAVFTNKIDADISCTALNNC